MQAIGIINTLPALFIANQEQQIIYLIKGAAGLFLVNSSRAKRRACRTNRKVRHDELRSTCQTR